MIIFNSANLTAKAEGYLKRVPTKIFRVETISTNGISEETMVRGKMDYDVIITQAEEDEYSKLIDMFFYENDFSIIDTDRNIDGQHYKMNTNDFMLNEVEDKKEKCFYYVGNFRIVKI